MADWSSRLSLAGQRGALFAWAPVCLGIGIGLYLLLPTEPAAPIWAALAALLCCGIGLLLLGFWRWPPLVAVVLVVLGLCLGGARSWQVAAPILDFRYYGAVDGRIVEIDRSASDALRLTLDRVVLERMDPDETPAHVRLSLHGDQRWLDPTPGQRIAVTGHLLPPQGPVEPGGFDFRRMAWFDRLGAVGYARTPALPLEPPGRALPVDRLRASVADYMRRHLPGEGGAFAAAITTGDRSGIGAATLEDLRRSNLAHLLAISGLHMGILTAVVFGVLRAALAALPRPALVWPCRSIAAIGALGGAAFYLALSGGNVATQRAFVMAAVVLVALVLGRRALTLRSVALAALVVLLLEPEALAGPGFQMSFAATAALVAAFRLLRDRFPGRRRGGPVGFLATLVLSSAVAGAATAPFSAAHFNQVSQYGLLANVLTVPLMGAVLMPGAVLAAVLAPLGFAWIGLWTMAPAISWILGVAHWVAGLDGAVIPVPSPGAAVLPVFSLGALFVMLWRGRLALAGLVPVAAAFGLWAASSRPDALIDASGGLIGVLGPEGRALSKDRGSGFAAAIWLENDGDPATQRQAAARPGLERAPATAVGQVGGVSLHHIFGRGGAERAAEVCLPGRIVVVSTETDIEGSCLLLDEKALAATGSVSLRAGPQGVTIVTTRAVTGNRPWSSPTETRGDQPIEASGLLAAVLPAQ